MYQWHEGQLRVHVIHDRKCCDWANSSKLMEFNYDVRILHIAFKVKYFK